MAVTGIPCGSILCYTMTLLYMVVRGASLLLPELPQHEQWSGWKW